MTKFGWAALGVAAAMWAAPASAAVLYDSGQPSSSVTGSGLGSSQSLGGRLIFGSSVTITGFEVYLKTSPQGVGDTLRLAVHSEELSPSDPALYNLLPGTLLYSEEMSAPAGTNWRGFSSLSWALAPGAYWFTIEAPDDPILGALPSVAPNSLARYAFTDYFGGRGWEAAGTAPFGLRIYGDGGDPVTLGDSWPQPAVVPEPSTWAMLLLGFGLTGAALRRRSGERLA